MKNATFKNFVLDQMRGLENIDGRAMFGGFGLYSGEVFFGILFQDRLYFKTDSATRREYTLQGMEPFQPNARQTLSRYYEVPVEVVENAEQLGEWARKAIACEK